ncbi:MAG: hypothetical protein FWG75_04795 [Cystobacterineae bacterium]|nr:hypothetical protein [Cystobacterineae bacterium]
MRCPECGAQAADDAAFCPKCDHILDPSLFLDELPAETPDHSHPRGNPRGNPRTHSRAQTPQPMSDDTNPRAQLSQLKSDDTNPRAQLPKPRAKPSSPSGADSRQSSRAKPSKQSPESPQERPADSPPPSNEALAEQWLAQRPEKSDFNEAEMLLSSLKTDFLAQSGPDKLLLISALGMIFSCFFQWQNLERSGEVLGFLSLGALIVPLAIASAGGMLWRKRIHGSFPLFPWLLQGLSGLAAILLCLVLAKVFWVSQSAAELLGPAAESSTPSLGLLMGLIFSLLNLAATGLGLKQN